MPKFVIERQYLVPMYQHIVVEAETLEEACVKAISDDIDWHPGNGQRQRSRDDHHRSQDGPRGI
jgi:hypothetical protein